jgi:S1-C subfamily serine protease
MSSLFQQLSDSMAETVAAVSPSVVRVEARRRLPCTGIAWSADIVVTSNHGVEQEENIYIGLHDGARAAAQLVGRDPANDLAVLRVPGGAMMPAQWGSDAALKVGTSGAGAGSTELSPSKQRWGSSARWWQGRARPKTPPRNATAVGWDRS